MERAALLDLVCGPAGPLADTHQRYRLVSHLASGGQAEVYRAVRVSGGISSTPVTVKVFRLTGDRPLADQLRSWDKGDAVLMDLNSRGVAGICRRADGFYGPPPHPPGSRPAGDAVAPYQVLDYLHGATLREYVAQRYGVGGKGPRLDAVAALTTLAGVLRELHEPADPRACPVIHMDVKPSNVIVLPNGEVRLIDFTSARYHWRDHITSVAYTVEAGAPEAFSGNIGPAYDVHGFGAVAYYLVTGDFPRGEAAWASDGVSNPPWAVLRRHPLLDANQALRGHLLAPVADRPEDRPRTADLAAWTSRLGELARRTHSSDVGVDWTGTGHAAATAAAAAAGLRPVAGTETGAFRRIEKLERELVELRSAFNGRAPVAAPLQPEPTKIARPPLDATRIAPRPPDAAHATPPGPGAPGSGTRGVASVPEPEPTAGPAPNPWSGQTPARPQDRRPPPDPAVVLKRGSEITGVGVMFAFVCWGIWSVASGENGFVEKFLVFVVVLAIGVGVFVLSRLVGRLVWERLMGRVRRSARGSHTLTGVYLAAAGLGFLNQTRWVVDLWQWLKALM